MFKDLGNLLHGKKNAVEYVQHLPLTNDTMTALSAIIAVHHAAVYLKKLLEAFCIALQFENKSWYCCTYRWCSS